MIGEIRDRETAEHAVQAALTGHLVLSTLHTNDALSSVTRLLDLGVPHFLILSTVIGIVAQRLVRVICKHCAESQPPSAMTEGIRGLIARQTPSMSLFDAAREEGMPTLREAAIEKVLRGITTVAEMVRVTSA